MERLRAERSFNYCPGISNIEWVGEYGRTFGRDSRTCLEWWPAQGMRDGGFEHDGGAISRPARHGAGARVLT